MTRLPGQAWNWKGTANSMTKQQENELEITGINQDGQGITRLNGLTVFVPGTIPGDRAVIQIVQQKSNYALDHGRQAGEHQAITIGNNNTIKRKAKAVVVQTKVWFADKKGATAAASCKRLPDPNRQYAK